MCKHLRHEGRSPSHFVFRSRHGSQAWLVRARSGFSQVELIGREMGSWLTGLVKPVGDARMGGDKLALSDIDFMVFGGGLLGGPSNLEYSTPCLQPALTEQCGQMDVKRIEPSTNTQSQLAGRVVGGPNRWEIWRQAAWSRVWRICARPIGRQWGRRGGEVERIVTT